MEGYVNSEDPNKISQMRQKGYSDMEIENSLRNPKNTITPIPQSNNIVYCSCGGHYVNRNADRKAHETTLKHKKFVSRRF